MAMKASLQNLKGKIMVRLLVAHHSCVFLQSQQLESGVVPSHSLQYGTEVLPHHLEFK